MLHRSQMIYVYLAFLFPYFLVATGETGDQLGYESVGCWHLPENDTTTARSLEGLNDELEGLYWDRVYSVRKCAIAAKNKQYKYFAVRNGGECLAGKRLRNKYRKHGRSEECSDGEGGHEAMNVYTITGNVPALEDFEGDILLTKVQQAMTRPLHLDVAAAGVWAKAEYLWGERTVPYHIPPSLAGHLLSQKFQHGIRHWHEQTCIRFVPKKGHRDWIELYREKNPLSRRCASSIGRIGGYQPIKLGDHCPAGSVIHEVGHALGLWHTQSRPDRDEYVRIRWENILPGKSDQFKKYSHGIVDTLGIKYDYLSIMHYGKDYFGKLDADRQHYLLTVETIDPKYQNQIGQRQTLTSSDILIINTLYGCPDYPHMWHNGDWSECSEACGSGQQTREVYCAKDGRERVAPKLCSKTKLPLKTRKCYGRNCVKCPFGWVSFSNACYQINLDKKSLKDAIDSCLNNGAGILTLKSNDEESYLRAELEKNNVNHMFYWLGAQYSPSKGAFLWPDGTQVVYNAWNKGEPRWGLDCVIMMNEKGWGTDRCDMERSYICKKELKAYKRTELNLEKPTGNAWLTGQWGECSVSCGGGQRSRKTFCAGKNGEKVAASLCKDPPPDAWEGCNIAPCPAPYRWHVKEWGDCSRSCGGGIRQRQKICADKNMMSTSWKLCKEKPPVTKKRCNEKQCPSKTTSTSLPATWQVSAWSKCSKTCGNGHQIRGIFCSRNDNRPLKERLCTGQPKPLTLKNCFQKACPSKQVRRRCSDKHVMCKVWIRQGSCKTSKWVRTTCRRGCRSC